MKNTKAIISKAVALAAVLVLAFGLTACGAKGKKITIEVTGPDGATSSFEGKTTDEFLFDAIDDVEGVTIDGYDSDWGYYITAVNGIEANYDTDGAYWSIYVNENYGEFGISQQPVTEGDVYSFVYTVDQAAE
jgi:hypothetical protein